MYEPHDYIQPVSDNTIIWRYLSLEKLLSLLHYKSLYFALPEQFEDPLEGAWFQKDFDEVEAYKDQKMKEQVLAYTSKKGFYSGMSCWHQSPDESQAMWRAYAEKGKGIVIQSTFGRLCQSFAKVSESVFIGKVTYVDHKRDNRCVGGIEFLRYFVKDISFAYEEEIRALRWYDKLGVGNNPPSQQDRSIPVDLRALIESIRVSPFSDPMFFEQVFLLVQKYLPEITVQNSSLRKSIPTFSIRD